MTFPDQLLLIRVDCSRARCEIKVVVYRVRSMYISYLPGWRGFGLAASQHDGRTLGKPRGTETLVTDLLGRL